MEKDVACITDALFLLQLVLLSVCASASLTVRGFLVKIEQTSFPFNLDEQLQVEAMGRKVRSAYILLVDYLSDWEF